ncbi:MAG: cytochrome c [Armatimonadota bacterium]|nr:cytochrome c [Armatimonadota bacterium]
MRRSVVVVLVVGVLVAGVVPAIRAGAEPATRPAGATMLVAQVSPQIERGRAVYGNSCARCHGAQGQGGDGPRLIGSPNSLKDYGTVQKLFDFVKTNMPENAPASLKDEEYWDVLAFILDANGLLPPNTTLGPETSDQVKLAP